MVKNINSAKKQEAPASPLAKIGRKEAEQMKKDPEILSRVVRYWLNQK